MITLLQYLMLCRKLPLSEFPSPWQVSEPLATQCLGATSLVMEQSIVCCERGVGYIDGDTISGRNFINCSRVYKYMLEQKDDVIGLFYQLYRVQRYSHFIDRGVAGVQARAGVLNTLGKVNPTFSMENGLYPRAYTYKQHIWTECNGV